ncbi:hypothetical protein J1N35_004393 [Gossypium stocksii]|uniref:Uncharacterized protein n=1 Tax=Gossypium stocksii TaxID=47602 RepID=A0A9D4AHZ5_9ROSI|nr:hypothetical protein J1N35_004393 [Gossypium stocksii]
MLLPNLINDGDNRDRVWIGYHFESSIQKGRTIVELMVDRGTEGESVRRRYGNAEVIKKNKTKEALESPEDRSMEYKDGKKRQRIQQEGNSDNTTLMITGSNIEISAATNEQADRMQ